MGEEDNKKGFAGLDSLSSDVPGVISYGKKAAPKSDVRKEQPRKTNTPHPQSGPEKEQSSSSVYKTEPLGSGESKGSGAKWFIGLAGIVFLIWVVSQESNNRGAVTSSPAPSTSYAKATPGENHFDYLVGAPARDERLAYTKPLVGSDRVLSVPQIRWCIRESIRIEAMRTETQNNAEVAKFNQIVDDHNRRCGSYQYRVGNLKRAQKDVESYRSFIVSEAVMEVRSWSDDVEYKPSKPSPSQLTRDVQKLLTELGYSPGPVDGLTGSKTRSAIEAFQRDIEITGDGGVTSELKQKLELYRQKYQQSSAISSSSRTSNNSEGVKNSLEKSGAPSTKSVFDIDRAAIENTCGWMKNSKGPASYYSCVDAQIRSLR